MNRTAILATGLCKTYQIPSVEIEALRDIDLMVEMGEFKALIGPSGSGKTTLLNIIGGIDKPTSGKIIVLGHDLNVEDEDALADFRCHNVGFVFQSYNLISTLTVSENIAFPMELAREPNHQVKARVAELLKIVNLEDRSYHFPSQLSGGEQQRVAFARALANEPAILLVDEPTGNLDVETGLRIVRLLEKSKKAGKTIVAATHDERILHLADERLRLVNGKLIDQNE